MNELNAIVDECVQQMRADGYSVEQCIAKYPERARELRPLLQAAQRLQRAREFAPSPAFKARARAKLLEYAGAHQRRPLLSWQPARQLAVALTVLVFVMLASTTAFAQAALPGDALYNWKLSSEQLWWTMSTDRVDVDLTLTERRITELTKVVGDPLNAAQARDGLSDVLDRLQGEATAEDGSEIEQALLAHQQKLQAHGIQDKKLDEAVRGGGKKK